MGIDWEDILGDSDDMATLYDNAFEDDYDDFFNGDDDEEIEEELDEDDIFDDELTIEDIFEVEQPDVHIEKSLNDLDFSESDLPF